MAHRGGKGVRGVVRVRLVVERQDVLYHVHDLALVGSARAHQVLHTTYVDRSGML